MKMRHLLALLLALAMVFSLAACGDNTPVDDDDDEKSSNSVDKDDEDGKDNNTDNSADSGNSNRPTKPAGQSILGNWTAVATTVSYDEIRQLSGLDGELEISYLLEITDDNLVMTFDMDAISHGLVDAFEIYMDNMGISTSQYEQMIGMSMEEYVNILASAWRSEAIEAEWEMEGNKLTYDYLNGLTNTMDTMDVTVEFDGEDMIWTGECMEQFIQSDTIRWTPVN